MSNPAERTKRPVWLLPLLAVGIAVAAFAWWPDASTPGPAPLPPADGSTDGTEAPAIGAANGGVPGPATTDGRAASAGDGTTTDDLTPDRTGLPGPAEQPQGVRGQIVDERGAARAGIAVHLIESGRNDPLRQVQRDMLAAVASCRSAADGGFALGLPIAEDKLYDLLVVSPEHAMLHRSGLRLVPDDWLDLGPLQLQPGTTIRGQVTIAGRGGLPVPQAVVQLLPAGTFADVAISALPDGEGSPIAEVAPDGFYELRRAPTRGVVRLAAWAPGFARVIRKDIELQEGGETRVDFELPPGRMVFGRVRSSDGTAIAGAHVEARPQRPDLPILHGFSDSNGEFRIDGLHPGSHDVRAAAVGFRTADWPEVDTSAPLELVLEEQHRVRVTATARTGRVLRSYRMTLRRFFPKDLDAPLDEATLRSGEIGAVPDVRPQRVALDSATDAAELVGVPDGTFVVEVEAEGYAKVSSLPFRLDAEAVASTVDVHVTVHQGAVLRGVVTDERGQPLAGATVTSQRDGLMPDHPLMRVLQGNVPQRATTRTVRTDAEGRFLLENLALADYQLLVEHPDACRSIERGIPCQAPTERALPPIRLQRGAIVHGRASIDGRITGQMKILLTTPPEVPAERSIRLETVTDGEGRYRFARRIPPGEYVLRGAAVASATPETEIFEQLRQLSRSSTRLLVAPGKDLVEHDLAIETDR